MRPTTILTVFAHCVVAWPVAAQCLPVKVVAPDGAPVDVFGRAVSAGPYVTLVGADGHEHGFPLSGATYVYSPTGVFVSEFTGPENRGGGFGRAVATDGRLALVGAGTGWPRIYAVHDNKVEFVQRLQTSDAYRRALGHAVALHAHVAVIGSTEDTENGGTLAGAAFVFERDPNGVWIETAKLLADDGDFGDQFGNAVAIHSDVIVVGAWQDEPFGNWSGSAYVFERGTSGAWAQTARLLASDGAPIDNFGRAVATNGDVTLVGSPRLARLGDPGGVYVYERSGPDWVETQLIQPSGGAGSNFGHAVAVDQNLAVVGAFQHDVDGVISAGAAYVFWRDDTGIWTQVAKLVAPDAGERDEFGRSVSIRGHRAVIGAWMDDDNGADSGSAYIFEVGPDRDGNGLMDLCECRADIDVDKRVTLSDLVIQLGAFGRGVESGAEIRHEDGDLDLDLDVDLEDVAMMLAALGEVCPCPGDLNGDSIADLTDLAIQLANFGTLEGALPEEGDLDGDGDVDLTDLSQLLSAFGTGCQ